VQNLWTTSLIIALGKPLYELSSLCLCIL